MRRAAFVLALSAALMVTALPAQAAPEKGNSATEIDLVCGPGATVTILVQFATGSAAVFDTAEGNGRQYVLSSLDERVYEGDPADEPAEDPAFAFTKTWGKRKGYNQSLTCEGRIVLTDEEFGTFTDFFDVVLSFK